MEMGLFNSFGAKNNEKKDTLEELQEKQMECLERLDAVTDGNRRAQLQEELKEIERKIAELNSVAGNQSTGMFRDTAEDLDSLKGARATQTETIIKTEPPVATKSEDQLLDEALAMLATPNYEEGVKRIIELAEQGYDWAQKKLGVMYYNGERVQKDMAKAIFWNQKAAEQGNVDAQRNLGVFYMSGQGVAQNYEKAMYWYEKAAEQGNVDAQYNLGMMYEENIGIAQNYEKAVYWYEKAAEQGFDEALADAGRMYLFGNGVLINYEKAASYFLAASNQGNARGKYFLGAMYYNGQGVPKNINKAVELLRASAAQGLDVAQEFLRDIGY